MKIINNMTQTYYRYDGKFYVVSDRKNFKINDIFIDGRDYCFKIIESEHDLVDVAFMAPELYYILEEATVQN